MQTPLNVDNISISDDPESESLFTPKFNSEHAAEPKYCWLIKQQNQDACVLICVSFKMSQNRLAFSRLLNYLIVSLALHFYSQK